MTIREQVRDQLPTWAATVQRDSHDAGTGEYRLDCRRDGRLAWRYDARGTRTIDDQADGCRPIPTLVTVGYGYACNCEDCDTMWGEISHPSRDFAAAWEDVDRDNWDATYEERDAALKEMAAALDAIPQGYFDDEDTD